MVNLRKASSTQQNISREKEMMKKMREKVKEWETEETKGETQGQQEDILEVLQKYPIVKSHLYKSNFFKKLSTSQLIKLNYICENIQNAGNFLNLENKHDGYYS